MKKFIFIFIFISFAFIVTSAQDKLQMKSYLEGGYYSGNYYIFNKDLTNIPVYNSTDNIFENKLYSSINFNVGWKGVSINADMITIINSCTLFSYEPVQTEYKIGLSYQYKMFSINAEHMCTHSTEKYLYGGGYTKIGVRVYFLNTK